MFIQDFMHKWRFMGIILSDMDSQGNYQKLFDLNVREEASFQHVDHSYGQPRQACTNPTQGTKNDKLYFVLKKCHISELTYMQPDGSGMS